MLTDRDCNVSIFPKIPLACALMLPPQGEKSHCKFGSITISRWGAFDQASCRRIATPKSRGRERWIALGVPAFLVVSAGARTKPPDFRSAHSSPARTAIHSTEIKQYAFANAANNNAAYRDRGSLACFDPHKSRLLGNAPVDGNLYLDAAIPPCLVRFRSGDRLGHTHHNSM